MVRRYARPREAGQTPARVSPRIHALATHRVRIHSIADIDAGLLSWLRRTCTSKSADRRHNRQICTGMPSSIRIPTTACNRQGGRRCRPAGGYRPAGVAAGRRRSWPWRDGDGPGCDQVINEYVDVGEQVFGWQHGDGPGHVFYPIFPPSRHAHQVLAWLEPHLASSGSPSLQLLGQGGRCLGGIRDHAFASSRPGSGPCRCR